MSRTCPSTRDRGRTRRRLLPVALLLSAPVLAGCDARDLYEKSFSLGIPKPITKQAETTYNLWLGTVATAAVVGAIVITMILFAAYRYRKRSDELPAQVRYNLPIEVLYTAVPFVIIGVLFYYTVISQNYIDKITPQAQGGAQVNIGVVGFQWNWIFRYEDEGVQTTGQRSGDATLVLPTDTTIRFTETSPDVIHSFWVPAFLFKRDVIPGRENAFEVTITKQGEYVGRCAELCGEKHSAMNFKLIAVSPEKYQSYIQTLKTNPANAITSDAGIGRVEPQKTTTNGSAE